MSASGAPSATSAWEPLRNRVFRGLWLTALVSSIGNWMQTVGAQWLLVHGPNASMLVALVQTASTAPVVLLALPAGVLADAFDRRRLLMILQGFLVVVGAALSALTVAGQMPPALLLTFTFALGAGAALEAPAWQALLPDLVTRAELPAAATLGGVSINLARAVGPALAGVIVARAGAGAVFALNAATELVFGAALAIWHPPTRAAVERPERFGPALHAGERYVRNAPVVRRIFLRSALFIVPAMALWALLPLVATERLGMGAGGYGLLLAALGVGAVAGALILPRLSARLSSNQQLIAASMLYAVVLVALVAVRNVTVVVVSLILVGLAWIAVLSCINAALQLFLPVWVRARGLATYLMVLFGGQALGALLWGLIAQRVGLVATFIAAAVAMVAGAATIRRWPLLNTTGQDRSPAVYWPEPHLVFEPEPERGPVIITVSYTVPATNESRFLDAMRLVRHSRLRTGATRWGLYRDGERPHRFVEIFAMPSWDEHLRQHGGRLTGTDRAFEERARALAESPPEVAHLIAAEAARPP